MGLTARDHTPLAGWRQVVRYVAEWVGGFGLVALVVGVPLSVIAAVLDAIPWMLVVALAVFALVLIGVSSLAIALATRGHSPPPETAG